MEHGRKYTFSAWCLVSTIGVVALATALLLVVLLLRGITLPAYVLEFFAGAVASIMGLGLGYNGGNVGATFAHTWSGAAKRDETNTHTTTRTVNETVSREIQERRTAAGDMEPTP